MTYLGSLEGGIVRKCELVVSALHGWRLARSMCSRPATGPHLCTPQPN